MQIPSYQIQNVLKVYARQLSQERTLSKNRSASANKISADSVTNSTEGKRQAIVDKVTRNIVERIITEGPKENTEEKITSRIEKNSVRISILPKKKISSHILRLMKTIKKKSIPCLLKTQNLLSGEWLSLPEKLQIAIWSCKEAKTPENINSLFFYLKVKFTWLG